MFLIDEQLCTGCGHCVEVCPADAITIRDAKATIHQSFCRQCGICADQCPVQAISESVPTYATQARQPEPLPQQQPGVVSQVLNAAEKLFEDGIRQLGSGKGRGKGRGRGSRGRSGRGGFRGRR